MNDNALIEFKKCTIGTFIHEAPRMGKTVRKLYRQNLITVGELLKLSENDLSERYGISRDKAKTITSIMSSYGLKMAP